MKNIRVYYAHSKMIYDTAQEKRELRWLRKHYKVVVDPNSDLGELGDIQPYLNVLRTCDLVVFSEYQKYVSKGTYTEVCHAQDNKIPVKIIRPSGTHLHLKDIRFLSINNLNDWKSQYAIVILKDKNRKKSK